MDPAHGRTGLQAPGQLRGVTLTINLKGKLVLAVSTMAVAAFARGAYAATQEAAPNGPRAFLSDVAKRLHVTPAQLSAALKGAAIDQLDAAVAAGRLTKAQADALKQRIEHGGPPALPGGVGNAAFPGHPWLFHRSMTPGAPVPPGAGPVGPRMRRFDCPHRGKLPPSGSGQATPKGSSAGASGWIPAPPPGSID